MPKPLGDFLMLDAVRESGGTALAVTDEEMLDAGAELGATKEFSRPPKARPASRSRSLLTSGFLKPEKGS